GEGEAEIRVLRDGAPPESLRLEKLTGGDQATWSKVNVPLDAYAGKVVAIELRARSGSPRGRVLFGGPVIAGRPPPAPPAPRERPRAVVVVVLSGVETGRLPPRATEGTLPALSDLYRESTRFERHRVPSTVTASVVASMLTGVSPRVHGV